MYRFMYSRSQRNLTHNNTSKPKGAPMRRSDGFWTVQDVRIQEFEFETWHYLVWILTRGSTKAAPQIRSDNLHGADVLLEITESHG